MGLPDRLLNPQRFNKVFIPIRCQSIAKILSIKIPLACKRSAVKAGKTVIFVTGFMSVLLGVNNISRQAILYPSRTLLYLYINMLLMLREHRNFSNEKCQFY